MAETVRLERIIRGRLPVVATFASHQWVDPGGGDVNRDGAYRPPDPYSADGPDLLAGGQSRGAGVLRRLQRAQCALPLHHRGGPASRRPTAADAVRDDDGQA